MINFNINILMTKLASKETCSGVFWTLLNRYTPDPKKVLEFICMYTFILSVFDLHTLQGAKLVIL